jgi:hypothetical protein
MEVAQTLALEQFEKFDQARLESEAAADDELERAAKRLERPAAKPSRKSGRRK